jgi:hypothetical protein
LVEPRLDLPYGLPEGAPAVERLTDESYFLDGGEDRTYLGGNDAF